MFVYQNKAGEICITFVDNKPVENPEYVISVDKDAKTISLAGATDVPAGDDEAAAKIAELEAEVTALEADVAAKDKTIADQTATIAEKDARIQELEEAAQAE